MVFVALFEPIQADKIELPGAKTFTQGPKLEKLERTSVLVVAPTQIASAADAGD